MCAVSSTRTRDDYTRKEYDEFNPPKVRRRDNHSIFFEDLLQKSIQPVCSVSYFSGRVLKRYIRRDYTSVPPRLRFLNQLKKYQREIIPWYSKEQTEEKYPIDFCYMRTVHLNQVNRLLSEYFWPGINVKESLQYPEYSVVVLYRELVIGCGLMNPEGYIMYLLVHREWRNSSIAKFMVYHLIQVIPQKDLTLHVSVTNNAVLLYQQFGFKAEKFLVNFYSKYLPPDSTLCKHAFLMRHRR